MEGEAGGVVFDSGSEINGEYPVEVIQEHGFEFVHTGVGAAELGCK